MIVDIPPQQYDNYFGGLIVIERQSNQVHRICLDLGYKPKPGNIVYACSVPGFEACLVVVPKVDKTITQKFHNELVRHELGHCSGWRHD
jgi:hypothetical protein